MALFQITALFMLSAWGCACGYILDNNSAAPDGSWFRPDYAFDPAAGGWLKYHIMPTTWLAAQQTCFYEGAYLASPINEHMFTALRELLQKHHAPTLYTGVHSWYSPEEYLSEEGVDLIEMPLEWAEGEPNNHNNSERCLAIFQPGLAADVDCDQLYPFVCYKGKDRGMHMTDCWNTDPGYKHINKTGSCYKLHKESKTWPQAHRICMAEGGHLAIIDDQTETQEIWKSYHSQSSHIEIHIGLRLTRAGWTYVDGRRVMTSRGIAGSGAGAAPEETTEEAPDGTKFRPGYHFYPEANGWLNVHTFPATWSEARLACHLEGATLASPLTEGLYSSMKDLLAKKNKTAFTGISSMSSVEDYFSVEGVHLSKMPIEWQENEPTNIHNDERCLTLSQAGMADVRCELVHHFMCYKEKVDGETRELNECGNYDKQYSKHPVTGSCYKFHDTAATWERAHSVCTAEGGHLAILNSEQEAEALAEMALKARAGKEPSFVVAIGYYYWPNSIGNCYPDKKPLIFSTLDGKDLDDSGYTRWAPADPDVPPNHFAPILYCGSFKVKNGELKGLASVDCKEPNPFVCELDAKKASA